MKKALRIGSILLAIIVVAVWAGMGANRGWTKHSVEVRTLDEVTGIEAIEHKKQFVPGIEMLGAGLLFSLLLFGGSFLIRTKISKNNPT
ncbi:MAG: hypothetical protein SFY81_01850 [Verrucomicrobiota bacterium]|nr:hypothetical protein [Verrucomicrobiota bacterium]